MTDILDKGEIPEWLPENAKRIIAEVNDENVRIEEEKQQEREEWRQTGYEQGKDLLARKHGQPTLPIEQKDIGKFQSPDSGAEDTQRLAAVSIYPASGALRKRVYEFVRERGERGATDEEIQDGLKMNPSTQRPRRVELIERGLVARSEERRETHSGRLATVWVAVAPEDAVPVLKPTLKGEESDDVPSVRSGEDSPLADDSGEA